MTNDAIKKMAQDKFPCLNTEQGDTLCINCASVEAVLFGASAHAKLLSEKGVEGAMVWKAGTIATNDSPQRWLCCDVIEALPALHKIEQLEKQLAKARSLYRVSCGHEDSWMAEYDAELSELDGK